MHSTDDDRDQQDIQRTMIMACCWLQSASAPKKKVGIPISNLKLDCLRHGSGKFEGRRPGPGC